MQNGFKDAHYVHTVMQNDHKQTQNDHKETQTCHFILWFWGRGLISDLYPIGLFSNSFIILKSPLPTTS